MHLVDTAIGHQGSSAIVGGGIPIGTGQALAARMRGEHRVCAVFFGDGAADQGVLYESVNFAMLRKLAVVYVLEDNGWSVCSRTSARQASANLFLRSDPELLWSADLDGNDVLAVREAASGAVARARDGLGPAFLRCRTYRIRGHAGSYSDAGLGYRSEEEIHDWEERCPVASLRGRLLVEGVATEAELDGLAADIDGELERAYAAAQAAPLPSADSLLRHLYEELDP